jgi:hypothetical protein
MSDSESKDAGQLVIPGAKGPALSEEVLSALAEEWINSIQLTPPRASTRAARDLVDDIARRFLRDTQPALDKSPTCAPETGRYRRHSAELMEGAEVK